MPISKPSLQGYILEEILAYLIRNTGYRLLVHSSQDRRDLADRPHGLVVRGRGAEHQADVLGQLSWIPAFTYPLRLFVEAKCRKNRSDISLVRNAVGVLDNLNQNYSPVREDSVAVQRFRYCYAVFSTAGFSESAADMALAHQISAIDLSGPEFLDLRDLVAALGDILNPAEEDEDEEGKS